MKESTKTFIRENIKAQMNMALTKTARECAHMEVTYAMTTPKKTRIEIENFFLD